SSQGSQPQGVDFGDVSEPREPREPSPHLRTGDSLTDSANRRAEHTYHACSREKDSQTGSQGSEGPQSPAFTPVSGGEPSLEPQPDLTDGFTMSMMDSRP